VFRALPDSDDRMGALGFARYTLRLGRKAEREGFAAVESTRLCNAACLPVSICCSDDQVTGKGEPITTVAVGYLPNARAARSPRAAGNGSSRT